MNKLLVLGIGVLMFVGLAGFVSAQTATPTPTTAASPTPTTTVPGGAPSTGYGG